MAAYLIRRVLLALVTIVFISVLSFVIIHLPPGDYDGEISWRELTYGGHQNRVRGPSRISVTRKS